MQLTPNVRAAFLSFLSSVYTKLINFVISRWHQFQLVALLFMSLEKLRSMFSLVNYCSIYQTSPEKQNRNVIVTVVAMTADLHRHRYWDDVLGSKIAKPYPEMT